MKAFTLLLIMAILVELVAAGLYLRHQAAMTIPLLPKEHLADTSIMPQLEELAAAAQSGNSEDWKRLAEGLLGKGFYSHAELAFRESLRRDPANFDAKFGLAYCLDRTGRIEQSSVAYSDVVQGAAKSPEEQAMQIYSLYAMGRNALRIEDEQSAHKLFLQNADYPAAEYQQAKLWVRSGEADQALPLIRKNLEKIPYSLGFHFLDQRAQEALGNEREAFMAKAMVERSAYLVSLNFGTDYVSPLNARTGIDALVAELMVAVDAKDWDKAEGICQDINNAVGETRVFVANPANDAMLQVFLHHQQPHKVLDLVEKLKAAGRVDAVTLEAAGDAYLIMNDPPKAVESWQRALKLKPSVSLHQKLANNLSEGKEFHLSQVAFRRGLEHYRRNRLRAAIPEFRKSIELAPQTAMAWFYLGEMYYHLDKPTEALEAFQQCLNLEPQHSQAADKVKFLTHKD